MCKPTQIQATGQPSDFPFRMDLHSNYDHGWTDRWDVAIASCTSSSSLRGLISFLFPKLLAANACMNHWIAISLFHVKMPNTIQILRQILLSHSPSVPLMKPSIQAIPIILPITFTIKHNWSETLVGHHSSQMSVFFLFLFFKKKHVGCCTL